MPDVTSLESGKAGRRGSGVESFRFVGIAARSSKRKRAAPVSWRVGGRERVSWPPAAETTPMATAIQKITLSSSRDIPFNKLVLSQSNVRRVKAGVSIEELAEDAYPAHAAQGSTSAGPRRPGERPYSFRPAADAIGRTPVTKRLAKAAPVPA